MVRNVWRSSSSVNCSMAIMLTGPSRSIFFFNWAMASSGVQGRLRGRGAGGVAGRSARRSRDVVGVLALDRLVDGGERRFR